MIKVGYKWRLDRDKNDKEIYRLITILHTNFGYMAVCEVLEDCKKEYSDNEKRGDMLVIELKYLRIIHNSNEDDLERETYLKELQTLLFNK